jgi:DNA-binding ferritin-like protein
MSQPNLMRLSHLVWELRFFAMASQAAHWRVFGPTSYSDHELYKRVYEKRDSRHSPNSMIERMSLSLSRPCTCTSALCSLVLL